MINPIQNDEQYESTLTRIDLLLDKELVLSESEELESLLILVKKYEDEHYKIPKPYSH